MVDRPLKSVTHGQCDARPTVTFPAAEHHRPLAGTKIYSLVTETHGCEQLAQSCCPAMHQPGVEPATYWSRVQRPSHYATEPPLVLHALKIHGPKCTLILIQWCASDLANSYFKIQSKSPCDNFVTVEHRSSEEREKETSDMQTESSPQTLEDHCNINNNMQLMDSNQNISISPEFLSNYKLKNLLSTQK